MFCPLGIAVIFTNIRQLGVVQQAQGVIRGTSSRGKKRVHNPAEDNMLTPALFPSNRLSSCLATQS